MNFSFVFIIVFFFLSCDRKKTSVEEEKLSPIESLNMNFDTTKYLSNDTLCHKNLGIIQLKDIKVVKACHVFFGDSLSKSLMYQDMQSQLPGEYNIQIGENSDAIYKRNGNIITIRFFFYNRIRDNRLFPDSIFFSNGVLYLSEKEISINNKSKLRDQMMEEFFYLIQVKNISNHIRVKHRLSSKIHG